ncbi:MAG: reprolysin-like metallopeptidase [Acidobacteriota bacterium]
MTWSPCRVLVTILVVTPFASAEPRPDWRAMHGSPLTVLDDPDRLVFTTPEGDAHHFVLDEVTEPQQSTRTGRGLIGLHDELVLTSHPGGWTGVVRLEDRAFVLRGDRSGRITQRTIDRSTLPPCSTPDTPVILEPEPPRPQGAGDDGSIIDVLVLTTTGFEEQAEDVFGTLQLVFDETNTILERSGVAFRYRLVGHRSVDYRPSIDIREDLEALRNTVDGEMDEVFAWRDACAADLVSLWREDDGWSCGIGRLPGAFSVATHDCILSNHTFAHELGHNLGAAHDRAAMGTNPVRGYGHGYVDHEGGFRTVMATTCSFACPRIGHHANPAVDYEGRPTGVALPSVDATDVALALNERAPRVALYRDSATRSCDPPGVAEEPLDLRVSRDGEQLALSVTVSRLATSYVVSEGDFSDFVLPTTRRCLSPSEESAGRAHFTLTMDEGWLVLAARNAQGTSSSGVRSTGHRRDLDWVGIDCP